MSDLAYQSFATTPAAIVRQHYASCGGSQPPTIDDFGRSLGRHVKINSTAPNQLYPVKFLIVIDDQEQTILSLKKTEAPDLVSGSNSITGHLNQIKENLGLTITQMAELFNVTRKTIYDWHEGAAPRPIMIARIETLLYVLGSQPSDVDRRKLKGVWNIPVSGKSFHEIFHDDELNSTDLKAALISKVHELHPRLVSSKNSHSPSSIYLGEAHTSDADRVADFG